MNAVLSEQELSGEPIGHRLRQPRTNYKIASLPLLFEMETFFYNNQVLKLLQSHAS